MPIDVTQIPEIIGDFLGIDPTIAGIIISIAITLGVLMALAVLNMKEIGIAIAGVSMLAVFTVMQWFDPWIMILVALIAAVMMGDWVSKRARSGEG